MGPGELKYGGPGPKGRRGGYAQMTVVGAVTVRGSAIELRSDPGHADQRDGRGDNIELHIAQPREVLQTGITQKVNRHQRNNHLVHAHIRLSVTTCCFDGSIVNRLRQEFCDWRHAGDKRASQIHGKIPFPRATLSILGIRSCVSQPRFRTNGQYAACEQRTILNTCRVWVNK